VSIQGDTPSRPGTRNGAASEFSQVFRVRKGHETVLRQTLEVIASAASESDRLLRSIGTLHEARWVLFDDDTRLLFMSSFDGDWDQYIDDFAQIIGAAIDEILQHVEGYPGFTSPHIREFLCGNQSTASWYFRAYPEQSVKEVHKAIRVSNAFQELLDTPQFSRVLDEAAD
jgi:hypothetical protein